MTSYGKFVHKRRKAPVHVDRIAAKASKQLRTDLLAYAATLGITESEAIRLAVERLIYDGQPKERAA